MKLNKQSWIVVFALMILIVMSGVVVSFSPNRCIFTPEIECIGCWMNSETDNLTIRFRNNIGEEAEFRFKAWKDMRSKTPVINCLCDGEESCVVKAGRATNLTCAFPSGTIEEDKSIKFSLEAIAIRTSSPEEQIKIIGELYASGSRSSFPTGLVVYAFILVLALALYIYLLRVANKRKKLKIWVKAGLNAFLKLALVIFILFNLFIIFIIGGAEPDYFLLFFYSIIFSFIFALPIGLIVDFYSNYKNKKEKTKKKKQN